MITEKSDAEAWDVLFEPTMDEVAAMVSHLSDRFSPLQFRVLTGVSSANWSMIAAGKRECDKLVKRVIWFMYMLDSCPDKLLSAFTSGEAIFMWGKNITHIPKLSKMSSLERLKALEQYIALIKKKNRAYSIDEIAVVCHVSPGQAATACKRLKYRTATHNVADVYVAGSRWYSMDWRKSAVELSKIWNIKVTTVRAARTRIEQMPAALVARNIYRSKNAKVQWFYPLWDDAKQIEVHAELVRLKENSEKKVDSMANRELQVLQNVKSNTENGQPSGDCVPGHTGEPIIPGSNASPGPHQNVDDQRGSAPV